MYTILRMILSVWIEINKVWIWIWINHETGSKHDHSITFCETIFAEWERAVNLRQSRPPGYRMWHPICHTTQTPVSSLSWLINSSSFHRAAGPAKHCIYQANVVIIPNNISPEFCAIWWAIASSITFLCNSVGDLKELDSIQGRRKTHAAINYQEGGCERGGGDLIPCIPPSSM